MEAMCIVFVFAALVLPRPAVAVPVRGRGGPPDGREPAATPHQTDRRIEMSNIALSWAFKCHVGNASAKAVLVYLADRADDDGSAAYPKIETIVNVTELSERTVRSSLKLLQERGFIRRGDQRYARLGKGGRNRLPQYCQVVWDLAVETDPSNLTWIRETHAAEHDPATMGADVDPEAGTVVENGDSKDVLPENVGTEPISSSANLAGLENEPEPALQMPQGQLCKSRTSGSANLAPPALQISQGCIYKDKTLQVNPPCKPLPSLPSGELPASGKRPAREGREERNDGTGLRSRVRDGPSRVRPLQAVSSPPRSRPNATCPGSDASSTVSPKPMPATMRPPWRSSSRSSTGYQRTRTGSVASTPRVVWPTTGTGSPTIGPSTGSNANANGTPRPAAAIGNPPLPSPLQCRTATRTATCIRSCANTCSPT